jgi:hypothetical protein
VSILQKEAAAAAAAAEGDAEMQAVEGSTPVMKEDSHHSSTETPAQDNPLAVNKVPW